MADQDKKVALVTGGAGFIGSFLCEELLREGYRVICIDDFSTGNVRNIEPYLRNPDFQFLRLDINIPFDLEAFPELEPFNLPFKGLHEIYHLAVPTSVKNFDQFKHKTLVTNSVGTKNILDIAVKYKSKIILASSSVVYGPRTADQEVFKENYNGVVDHLTPRACYDEGKQFAETLFYTYRDVFGIDARIARVFRTYGPRMPLFDGHQIPDFILNALNGDPLVINGDPELKSSFVYVKDTVDGIVRVLHAPTDLGPVNLGSDAEISITQVAQKIIDMTGSQSQIEFGQSDEILSELGRPDIQKAKLELAWTPLVLLEDGLRRTIDYIQANKILLTSEHE